MTTTTGSGTSATSGTTAANSGDPAVASGDIDRLNPADGLFLRAEHLETIEDYARELALSVGVAAGCGVVWGYRVRLENATTLKVDPGLAIAPDGRPLRSRQTAELDLSDVALADDRFWVVEIVPATWDFGEENVYGNLCEDPCGSGSPIRPYRAEGVRVRLREDTMPGLSAVSSQRQRNWLASQYFERERERRGTWLLPDGSGAAITPILDRDWSLPVDAPKGDATDADSSGAAVPVAALLRVDGSWLLDVWIARRDLSDQHPKCGWQDRLGMRPWHVFIAQVLQFQAQLADGFPAALSKESAAAAAGDITDVIAQLREQAAKIRSKSAHVFTEGLAAIEEAIPRAQGRGATTLRELGIDELPPAGYLPAPARELERRELAEVTRDELLVGFAQRLFGGSVDVRVCHCRADFVAHAVEAAQHLDRIPLDPDVQRGRPQVDLLVPSRRADLPALYTPAYPWVAFVRRRDCDCDGADTEDVDVYIVDAGQRYRGAIAEILKNKDVPEQSPVGRLKYPVDTYAVPVPFERAEAIRDAVRDRQDREWTAIALARREDRQPLGVTRAALLAMYFEDGSGRIDGPELKGAWGPDVEPEKIVLVFGNRERERPRGPQ